MTENHHTPIAVLADANANVMTAPQGELDSAVTNILAGAQDFTGLQVGTGSLDVTALLEIISTAKGVLIPRMTTTQRDLITTPATALLIYNTTTAQFEFYTGTAWAAVGSSTFAGCRVFHNANQDVSDITETALALNSEDYDTDTFHDTSTNNERITIPTGFGGKYLITANIEFDIGLATGLRQLSIRLNGTTVIASQNMSAAANLNARLVCSTIYDLVATDYVECMAFHSDGATLNLRQANFFSPWFMASYLGA